MLQDAQLTHNTLTHWHQWNVSIADLAASQRQTEQLHEVLVTVAPACNWANPQVQSYSNLCGLLLMQRRVASRRQCQVSGSACEVTLAMFWRILTEP